MAERRLRSRLMIPKTPRFWPEMNTRRGVVVVDIGALDQAAGELLGGFDDPAERVPVVRVSRQRPGMKHELPARRAGIGWRNLTTDRAPETFALLATPDYVRTGLKTQKSKRDEE